MEKKTKTAACRGGGGGGDLPPLPEDFLIQILVRLPLTSLLRFKSVCKSWRDLIQSSFFIHLHAVATTSNSSSNFGTFILQVSQYYPVVEHGHYIYSMQSEILTLSSESGSEYGDWYWCTDGSWHKFTGSGGGDWHWDNTNCGWYWVTDGGDWVWGDTNCRWYWVGDDKDDKKSDDDQEVFKDDDDQLVLDNLELPSCYKLSYSEEVIAGSCNGLICLHDSYLRTVSLWNPATRQFRRLPKSITIEIDDDFIAYGCDFVGFGFDVKTKDYKVVQISCFTLKSIAQRRPECICRVQVYSLSTDSWRLLEGIHSLPGLPMLGHHGLYLNGSCFFIAHFFYTEWKLYEKVSTNDRFIISFDFTKEIITTMQFPDHDHRHQLFLSCLGGEKMALFTTLQKTSSPSSPSLDYEYEYEYEHDNDGYEDCDIWVLNEHGGGCGVVNKESWTKLHSFQIKNTGVLPRGISNNGKFAFLETRDSGSSRSRMQLYNLVTKEAKMDFLLCERLSTAHVYKPSLVSIIGGNGAAASAAPAIG